MGELVNGMELHSFSQNRLEVEMSRKMGRNKKSREKFSKSQKECLRIGNYGM